MPHVSGRSISDSVETFFQKNHPDHYLCHQVIGCPLPILVQKLHSSRTHSMPASNAFPSNLLSTKFPFTCEHFCYLLYAHYLVWIFSQTVYDDNKFARLVRKRNRLQNWLDYNQLKFERHPDKKRPTSKVYSLVE